MLLQKITCLLTGVILSVVVYGQTEINHRIHMTGTDTSDRQVLNLAEPTTLHSAIRPEDVKYGKYNFASAIGSDTIQLTFPAPFERLMEGDLFFFNLPGNNTKNIILSVTGMDTLIPLMINARDSVGKGRLFAGQSVGAIYRNQMAYMITPVSKTCPSGFVKVNDNYCIETNERAASNFFMAATTCIDLNTELCNLGEWYHACVNRTTLGIAGMTNNFEWLDDASNDVMQAKVIGDGACTTMGNVYGNTGSLTFRCCYILK